MKQSTSSKGATANAIAPTMPKKRKAWLKSKKAKRLFGFCRWLHIYISSALFSLLLFFSITGITLNHPQWGASASTNVTELAWPSQITIVDNAEYPIKQIQRHIEVLTGLADPKNIDLALDLGELTFDYPLPAGYAFVTVFIEDHIIEMESSTGGMLALLNDLHKGRHSGEVWSWIIDISAVLISLFTLTGIIILLQNAKHRVRATYVLVIGTLTPLIFYLLAVPRLVM